MIDIHSHILPHMDDGSASPEETAALLELLRQQGVTTVAATPHFYATQETPQAFLKRRQEAVNRLLPPAPGQPRILLGAEVAYFFGIGNCEDIIPLQIENTKLILIEMPFATWSSTMVNDICKIPTQLGLIPVLAHVNRYRHRGQFPTHMHALAESGACFQCNAEAFETAAGRRWAMKLLKNGQLHFLGSDCHDLTVRPPKLHLAEEAINKKFGPAFLGNLTGNAAQMLLLDKS